MASKELQARCRICKPYRDFLKQSCAVGIRPQHYGRHVAYFLNNFFLLFLLAVKRGKELPNMCSLANTNKCNFFSFWKLVSRVLQKVLWIISAGGVPEKTSSWSTFWLWQLWFRGLELNVWTDRETEHQQCGFCKAVKWTRNMTRFPVIPRVVWLG